MPSNMLQGRFAIALAYSKNPKLLHYAPHEVEDIGKGRLEHSHAIPISFDQKNAVGAGAKAPLYASQLPLAMYTVIFELLIPESMNVFL